MDMVIAVVALGGVDLLESSSFVEKDLGVLVDNKLIMS